MEQPKEAIYFITHLTLKIDLLNWEIIPFRRGNWSQSLGTQLFFLCFEIIITRGIKFKNK